MIKIASYLTIDEPTTSLKKTVRFRKPGSNNPREIRDIILRDDFGYTPEEIEAFNDNKTYADNHIIVHNKKTVWATFKEVESWKPGTDGLIPIELTDDWVLGVLNFKIIRAEMEIFRVGNFIMDASLRDEVSKYFGDFLVNRRKTHKGV